MSTDVRADTLMGAALAPLDATRSAGLVIVFSLFIAACAQFSIPDRTGADYGAEFCSAPDRRFAWLAFGRGGGDCLLIEGALGLPFFAGGGAGSCGSLVQPVVIWSRFRPRRS